MGLVRRSCITLMAVAGLTVTSQAPEFSQQYRQRLGGAVEELKTITVQFDKDADTANLSRFEALRSMRQSPDGFLQTRGQSMAQTIARFENLRGQLRAMEHSPDLFQPFNLLGHVDTKISQDTWQIFKPAIPLTFSGFVWGGFGAFIMGMFGVLLLRLLHIRRSPKLGKTKTSKGIKGGINAPQITWDN